MRQYLGIGLRDELIPLILHLFLQWNIVLNDSIMYYSNGTGIIHMGMGIDITGSTVGCPTSMPDTGGSLHSLASVCQVFQNLKSPDSLFGVDLLPIKNSHTRGIISTVFQFGQTV